MWSSCWLCYHCVLGTFWIETSSGIFISSKAWTWLHSWDLCKRPMATETLQVITHTQFHSPNSKMQVSFCHSLSRWATLRSDLLKSFSCCEVQRISGRQADSNGPKGTHRRVARTHYKNKLEQCFPGGGSQYQFTIHQEANIRLTFHQATLDPLSKNYF